MEVDHGGIDFYFLSPYGVSYRKLLITIEKGLIIMTIRELSRKFKIPYTTTWKYLKILEQRGFIRITKGDRGAKIDNHAIMIFKDFVDLIKEGHTIASALEKLSAGYVVADRPVIEYLQRLEHRIEELEKENRALRDIVQKYLAEIEKLKGLPPPKKKWRERIKAWFTRKRESQEHS